MSHPLRFPFPLRWLIALLLASSVCRGQTLPSWGSQTGIEVCLSDSSPTPELLPSVAFVSLQDDADETLLEEEGWDEAPAMPSEPIGREPADNSQVVLRNSAVLLDPHSWQVEYGFVYTYYEAESTIFLPDDSLDTERLIDRQWIVPLSIRYGATPRLQIYANVPFAGAYTSIEDSISDIETSVGGVGDISAGLNYVLRDGQDVVPDVIGSFSFSAPVGKHPFVSGPVIAAIGSGFWRIAGDVTLIRAYDPIVFYGTLGYEHIFGRDFDGFHYQPGGVAFYSFGGSLSINNTVSLTTELYGAFQWDETVDGERLPNSGTEATSLRISVIRQINPCCFIEPSVEYGVTQDAGAYVVGVSVVRSF